VYSQQWVFICIRDTELKSTVFCEILTVSKFVIINSVSTLFDTVTAIEQKKKETIMSCAKSWKRFSGDWLLFDSLQSLAD